MTVGGGTLQPENRQGPGNNPVSLPAAQASSSSAVERYTGLELWLHRLNVLVFVFLCASMGVLLMIVPWWPQWTDNYLLLRHPILYAMLAGGFGRGVCSGLGLLDVWIGFSAAIHYHEDKPA